MLHAIWKHGTACSKELAQHLCLSPRTIDTYFTNMMTLLDIHDRTGILIHSLKHGWVGDNSEGEKPTKVAGEGGNKTPAFEGETSQRKTDKEK